MKSEQDILFPMFWGSQGKRNVGFTSGLGGWSWLEQAPTAQEQKTQSAAERGAGQVSGRCGKPPAVLRLGEC